MQDLIQNAVNTKEMMCADSSNDKGFNAKQTRLSGVFALATETEVSWTAEELRAILANQLSVPLESELGHANPALTTKYLGLSQAGRPVPKSLGELFHDPRPSVTLLKLAKDFAKAAQKRPASAIPEDVALVLYYLSIAAGLARRGQRITQLTDDQLRQGFDWAQKQPWLVEEAKQLLAEGRQKLTR